MKTFLMLLVVFFVGCGGSDSGVLQKKEKRATIQVSSPLILDSEMIERKQREKKEEEKKERARKLHEEKLAKAGDPNTAYEELVLMSQEESDQEILTVLAENKSGSTIITINIFDRNIDGWEIVLAGSPYLIDSMIQKMVCNKKPEVFAKLLKNKLFLPEYLKNIDFKTCSEDLLRVLANNVEKLSEMKVRELLELGNQNEELIRIICRNPRCPGQVQAILAMDFKKIVEQELVPCSHVTTLVLEKFATCANIETRKIVASNPGVSNDALKKLADSYCDEVILAVLKNPSIKAIKEEIKKIILKKNPDFFKKYPNLQ